MRATRCVPPAPGNRPILISGRPTPRLVVVGGDAMVAGEAQLEAAAERGAVDRRDPRLAAGLEPPVEQRELAALLEQARDRRLLALRLGQVGERRGSSISSMREIGAGAERVLAGGDDRALDRGVGRDLLDDRRRVPRSPSRSMTFIERPGHVPGDERDAVGVDVELEIAVAHRSSRRSRRSAPAGQDLDTACRPCAVAKAVVVADHHADRRSGYSARSCFERVPISR